MESKSDKIKEKERKWPLKISNNNIQKIAVVKN
jgi:hypothetical protein